MVLSIRYCFKIINGPSKALNTRSIHSSFDSHMPFPFFLQVPDLAGSWLLTTILQLPLILFLLLNEATIILPLERAVHIVMTCFIVVEVILGFFAIRAMVTSQMVKFHLQQFTDLDDVDRQQFNNEFMFENKYNQ